MVTTIYLIRHGETGWAEQSRYAGRKDIPLVDKGILQAKYLARKMAKIQIDKIFSSPLLRCRQTAAIICENLNLSYQVVEDLVEIDFGKWDGLFRDQITSQFPELWNDWLRDPCAVMPPGGETVFQVAARVVPAIHSIARNNPGNIVAIVSHKTVNRIFLCHILGIPLGHYRQKIMQEASCINLLSFDGEQFTVQMLNNIDHLSQM